MAEPKVNDRPGLNAWKVRAELRRSQATVPVPSGKQYRRKAKHRAARGW